MADIKYKYKDTSHKIDTYDNVINTYEWIHNALRAFFQEGAELQLYCTVRFSSNEMSYDCSSIDEFKKYA